MTDQPRSEQPTEEELRAYLEQLREADVAQVIVQAYQVLGTGAEVKLGRRDARVLIDTMAQLSETAAGELPDELVTQMREGVRQLQLAQVQAEREGAAAGTAAGGAGGEQAPSAGAGAGGPPQPSGGQPSGGQAPGQQGGQKLTDRLWIPGREPGAS